MAHAGLAAGAWAGLRPGGAVGWGGAGGAHLAPGTACGSTATASLPSRRGRGHAALGLLQVAMEKIKASPALAWNNVKSLASGKGSEACSRSAERAHSGPSPLACV